MYGESNGVEGRRALILMLPAHFLLPILVVHSRVNESPCSVQKAPGFCQGCRVWQMGQVRGNMYVWPLLPMLPGVQPRKELPGGLFCLSLDVNDED